ncbi:MAG TPA: hypothetical protein VMN03_01000, partial [Burkholderiales bacterium]|nr:hypothetical protein [Burkholderiales bacterium]
DRAIAPAIVRRATEWRSAPLDKRKRRWTVNSVYEPGGSLTAPANWPSAESRFVPVPGAPFLSKPAGVGGPADAQRHYISYQCGDSTLQECSAESLLLVNRTWHIGTWGSFPDPNPITSRGDGAVRTYPTPSFYSVAFADLNDLGRGRRVGCTIEGWGSNPTIFCWATSHGPVPAAGASVDGPALALAAERYVDRNNITFNTIHISRRGALFGAWTPPTPPWPASRDSRGPTRYLRGDSAPWWGASKNDRPPDWLLSRNWDVANREPWQREAIVAAVARPSLATGLDSQGPKSVPHACLSCHGGRYDVSTGWVQGASLLPLIPADLTFSSPAVRAKTGVPYSWPDSRQNSEEALRKINEIIYQSNPSSTIKQRIATLYGGTSAAPAGAPGTRANDLAVPPGWSAQPGLYRQVIAPYCGSCHFAQSGALSFRSYAAVLQVKQAIQRTVCTDFTMPHSEILFRKFWTEGGSVSLPGLLSTALGFPKCLQ